MIIDLINMINMLGIREMNRNKGLTANLFLASELITYGNYRTKPTGQGLQEYRNYLLQMSQCQKPQDTFWVPVEFWVFALFWPTAY